jgi:hypothetical protein
MVDSVMSLDTKSLRVKTIDSNRPARPGLALPLAVFMPWHQQSTACLLLAPCSVQPGEERAGRGIPASGEQAKLLLQNSDEELGKLMGDKHVLIAGRLRASLDSYFSWSSPDKAGSGKASTGKGKGKGRASSASSQPTAPGATSSSGGQQASARFRMPPGDAAAFKALLDARFQPCDPKNKETYKLAPTLPEARMVQVRKGSVHMAAYPECHVGMHASRSPHGNCTSHTAQRGGPRHITQHMMDEFCFAVGLACHYSARRVWWAS